MNEQRLIELETKFAHHERTVQVLNEVVTRQQKELDELRLLCRQLLERLNNSGEGVFRGTAAEEVPPHY
jgi:SlyX protein